MNLHVARAERAFPGKGQDAILQNDQLGLFAVLDGLTGYRCGDVASQTARDAIEEYFVERAPITKSNALLIIDEAVRQAGQALERVLQEGRGARLMATTLSLLCLFEDDGQAWHALGQIGDSRIYRCRVIDGSIGQLTHDEVTHCGLTNALSAMSARCQQMDLANLRPGDRFVICSDGVYGRESWPLSTGFREALLAPNPYVAAEELLLQKTLNDDKSVLVIDRT